MMLPRWFLWTIATLISWGLWAILSKLIGDQISPAHSQVLSTIGILPILGILWYFSDPDEQVLQDASPRQRRRGIAFALGSGIVSSVGNVPFYHLLSGGTNAASAVAVTAMAPMVTILLAVLFLREYLNRIQVCGIGLALIAIYLFNVPGEDEFLSAWLLMALVPIGLWGLTGFLQKVATNYITGRQSALWFLVAFVPVAAMIALWDPPPIRLSPYLWLLTALLGFTLAFGNLTILLAFASGGKASIISPMSGLYPLISAPIAILAFGEDVSLREWCGIILAMLAVVAIARESTVETTSLLSTNSVETNETNS